MSEAVERHNYIQKKFQSLVNFFFFFNMKKKKKFQPSLFNWLQEVSDGTKSKT